MDTNPIIRNFEPVEEWGSCHVDEVFTEPAPRPT